MAEVSITDWESIEQDYRVGLKTLRQIASENGVTHGAINKRAKRDGWERDLSAKIAAKVETLVSKRAVSKKVSKEQKITEKLIVDTNALSIADKIIAQQSVSGKAVGYAESLLNEAIAMSACPDYLERLGELMLEPDDKGMDKLNEAYRKIISMGGRVDAGKKIVEMLKASVELERKVLRIKDDSDPLATLTIKADSNLSPAEAYKLVINGN